jgi:RNA polymerase sigma-70 factor (sigma-E family)
MDIEHEREFREFVSSRSKSLLHTAYLVTGDWELGRDLLQGALAATARRWSKLNDKGMAEAYVRHAMYNAHIDRTRRLSWRRETSTDVLPEHAATVADPADAVVRRRELVDALKRLPRGQRAVIVLRYFEDRTDAEIADILGITTGTVRSQRHKALASLRVAVPHPHPISSPREATT